MTGGDVFICNVLLPAIFVQKLRVPRLTVSCFSFPALYEHIKDQGPHNSGDKSYKWYQVIPCSQNNPPICSPPPAQIPASGGCWHISISNPFNEDSCSSDREMCSLAAIPPPPPLIIVIASNTPFVQILKLGGGNILLAPPC